MSDQKFEPMSLASDQATFFTIITLFPYLAIWQSHTLRALAVCVCVCVCVCTHLVNVINMRAHILEEVHHLNL